MSPSFGEKVRKGESVVEKCIIREIEKLEDELEYVSGKLHRNGTRIR